MLKLNTTRTQENIYGQQQIQNQALSFGVAEKNLSRVGVLYILIYPYFEWMPFKSDKTKGKTFWQVYILNNWNFIGFG